MGGVGAVGPLLGQPRREALSGELQPFDVKLLESLDAELMLVAAKFAQSGTLFEGGFEPEVVEMALERFGQARMRIGAGGAQGPGDEGRQRAGLALLQ